MKNISIRALITDDDVRVSTHIANLLNTQYPDIEILDKPTSVLSTVKSIKLHKPNLIFLDIDLGNETSFDILDQIDRNDGLPEIIFVTAHESYAIRSIKNQPIDYLLKPINRIHLYAAVDKARAKIFDRYCIKSIKSLNNANKYADSKIQIPQIDGIEFINLTDIIFLRAQRNYTEVILKENRTLLSSKTLKHFTEILPSQLFFRPHRSFSINLYAIKSFKTSDGGYLIMSNGDEVSITKSKRAELFNILNNTYLNQND